MVDQRLAGPHFSPMQNREGLRSYLAAQLPAGLGMLREMVGINSYTANSEGVNKLGAYTAAAFAPIGFSSEFVPSANPQWGEHLVLTRRGRSTGSIAMISHLDTVFPPEEEERNHFCWQVEGDRIYGPGTHDIKGGTMMMWLVLSALKNFVPDVFEEITWKLFWNSSEETFSEDFGTVCRDRFEAGTIAALVYEAEGRSDGKRLLVASRKGRATWRATVRGRGAHAGGNHGAGANAIVQLAGIIQKIAALTDYECGITFNVGTIAGGTVLNRVPHEAFAEGEFRAFDGDTFELAKSELLGLAGTGDLQSPHDGYRCRIEIELLSKSRPWPRNEATDKLFAIWKETGDDLGLPVDFEQRGGLSDGNMVWDVVPTLDGLGPWGENDHCSERSADGTKTPEYVELSSIVPKALLNVCAIARLAGF